LTFVFACLIFFAIFLYLLCVSCAKRGNSYDRVCPSARLSRCGIRKGINKRRPKLMRFSAFRQIESSFRQNKDVAEIRKKFLQVHQFEKFDKTVYDRCCWHRSRL